VPATAVQQISGIDLSTLATFSKMNDLVAVVPAAVDAAVGAADGAASSDQPPQCNHGVTDAIGNSPSRLCPLRSHR